MPSTTNLNIALVASNQAQKEVTVNGAITRIDAILNSGAIDRGLNTPPGSPVDGDLYIIGAAPTGAWASNTDDVAYYQSGWSFISPNEGMTIWANDEDLFYTWDGSAWISIATNPLDNLARLGINATSDSTNKLAVASDAVLFDNNGSGSQVKVNKNASGDTASHLFQVSSSGRAEFGLVGDNHYQVKVSDDGSTWYQSYVITNSTGDIEFKKRVTRARTTPASASGALTLDLDNGTAFEVTLTENVTTTVFSNAPASGSYGEFKLILKQDGTGGRTFAWPASVDWAGGSAPTLTTAASAVDILEFASTDGGTIWYGLLKGADMG